MVTVMVFQSTLPQGERRVVFGRRWEEFIISIHAPARGATEIYGVRDYFEADFNPLSRKGSDSICHIMALNGVYISIHAPARGATECKEELDNIGIISIHAPARGATDGKT